MASYKADKIMHDALLRAAKRNVAKGSRTKYTELIARRVVEAAAQGEQWACQLVFDRIDGKAIQPVEANTKSEIVYRVELIDLSGDEPKTIDVTPQKALVNGH